MGVGDVVSEAGALAADIAVGSHGALLELGSCYGLGSADREGQG
jgi:hypothetical protein